MTTTGEHRRRAVLLAVLGFLPTRAPRTRTAGVASLARQLARRRLAVIGLHRIGYDLDLRQYGDGRWRASFYVTGFAHSILGGSHGEATAWRAVQRTRRDSMQDAERNLWAAPRRVCLLCGALFVIVLPAGASETERDRLCPGCSGLPERLLE
jgi:hypothetical protein